MINVCNWMEQELQNNLFCRVIGRNDNHHPLRVLQERNHRIELECNNHDDDINDINNSNRRRGHTNFDHNFMINGLAAATRRYRNNNIQIGVEQASTRRNGPYHFLVSVQNNDNNRQQQRQTMRRMAIQENILLPLFHHPIYENDNVSNLENVPRGISQMEIEQRTHSFTIKEKETLGQENQACAICQMDFKKDDSVRQLSLICTHLFHKDCIDRWMREQQPTCPVCRKNIIDNHMGI